MTRSRYNTPTDDSRVTIGNAAVMSIDLRLMSPNLMSFPASESGVLIIQATCVSSLAVRASESDGWTASWRVKILRSFCTASKGSTWEWQTARLSGFPWRVRGGYVVDRVVPGQCILAVLRFYPRQYHSTIAPYSFIHLPPTLYNVFLPVLQLFLVSIIAPLLHTHPFIHHWHLTALLNKSLLVRFLVLTAEM